MAQTYFLLPTADGEAKLANAQALGIPLKLTHMAVGDGNGVLPVPNRDRKALVNEKRRAPVNSLTQDPANLSQIIAEQVIPEDVGGWWIREAGLFDESGTLIYYSNIPETYKPQLAEGSGRQQVVRMVCVVTSGAVVELKIDPSIVLATRAYADAQATLARAYADTQDAQTRAYADAQIAAELAKLDTKQSVLIATTATLAALSGLQTVDGVVLTAGARVLVKDQIAGKDNGIYVAAAGAWTRAVDADASIEVTPGLFVTVEQGNVNADSVWQLVTDAPITLGTTALVFEMLGGKTGVTAGTYSRVTVDVRGRVTGGTNPVPTESVAAPVQVATDAELTAGTDDSHFVTPKKLATRLGALLVQATEAVFGWAKIATQALTDACTDDKTIVTPKKLRWGFSILLSGNGYIVLPSWMGGLIIQWGQGTVGWGTSGSIIFPLVFPAACYGGVLTVSNAQTALAVSCAGLSQAGIGAVHNGTTNQVVLYITIGK